MRYSILALALFALPAFAAEKPVTVNGVVIPGATIEAGMKAMKAQGAPDGAQLRPMVVQKLVADELVIQEAARRGLEKTPAFKTQMDIARKQILAQQMVAEWSKANPVDDKTIQAEYDRLKANAGATEYQVRHIMVDNEAEASGIIASLAKGAKFEDLAKQKSDDKGSAAQGGSLGWVTPNQFPPSFAGAVKSLGKGQTVKAPVKTEAGWHIIKIDDSRAAKIPSFAEAKPNISRQLQARKFEEFLGQLQAKAKIVQ